MGLISRVSSRTYRGLKTRLSTMLGTGMKVATLAGQTSVRNSSGRLKELGIRIKSVTNIQKITKTMNMISAAKYAKAAKELEATRAFGNAGAGVTKALASEDAAPVEGGQLIILASSDRGLCGALHTNLARAAAEKMKSTQNGKYICIGDKATISLKAMKEQDKFAITCKEVCRNKPNFGEAALVAQAALEHDFDWKSGTIFYNFHKSAMTQEILELGVSSEEGLTSLHGIEAYDSVDEDVVKSFAEFAFASTLFGALKENYISEQAARMISMDGATKNAGDMIEKMTLQYNRLRQAVITTELCEIIAGMAAL